MVVISPFVVNFSSPQLAKMKIFLAEAEILPAEIKILSAEMKILPQKVKILLGEMKTFA